MAKYVASGTSYNLITSYVVDGVPVTPTNASYSLYDNSLSVVDGILDEAITITGDSSVIVLPDTANIQTLDNEFRLLRVKFEYQSVTYYNEHYYFLRDSVFFPLSADDVRAIVGVSGRDIPDDFIDILSAYDEVTFETNGLDTSLIISTGGPLLGALINAVKYKAALNSVIVLNSNMFKIEQADNTLYQRFDNFDFSGVLGDLNGKYALYMSRLTGTSLTERAYSTLAFGTDPVTGA